MAELRSILERKELKDVQTYIQNGNVIFRAVERHAKELEKKIAMAILETFGFNVPVLVITPEELRLILNRCPFSEEKKESSYFTLLHESPDDVRVGEVQKLNYPNEEFVITDSFIYLYSSAGYGRAKCNNNFFEKKLKVSATTRNYKTMMKLLSLCEELS